MQCALDSHFLTCTLFGPYVHLACRIVTNEDNSQMKRIFHIAHLFFKLFSDISGKFFSGQNHDVYEVWDVCYLLTPGLIPNPLMDGRGIFNI